MKNRSIQQAVLFALLVPVSAFSQEELWTGNFVKDPGFEEDFVNNNAEAHVLSFKGDWFYNQKDLMPDYWLLTGSWTWNDQAPREGSIR